MRLKCLFTVLERKFHFFANIVENRPHHHMIYTFAHFVSAPNTASIDCASISYHNNPILSKSQDEICPLLRHTNGIFHCLCEWWIDRFHDVNDKKTDISQKTQSGNCSPMHMANEMTFCMPFCRNQCLPHANCNKHISEIKTSSY